VDKRDDSFYHAIMVPTNLAAGAVAGNWLSLENANHVEFIINKAAGATGEAPTFTFVQATDGSGTGSKALNIPGGKYTRKTGADVDAVALPTLVEAAAGNTIVLAAGDTEEVVVVEFDAQNLDINNGFRFIGITIADPGTTAQYCSILARFSELGIPPFKSDWNG
jgi:LysM repeat protein